MAWLVTPGSAGAQAVDGSGSDLLVTVAARSCPTYDSITANLARNDIQESLQDLGADTEYTAGEPINPTKEADGQPRCTPLPGWRFTLGTAIGGATTGTWGSLSYVSNPFSTDVVTRESTPTLDEKGRAVPGQSIQGATTIELTGQQADDAIANTLWIQGGTVSDPVLDQVYPGAYGFGALRCAIDNLNGDNVEYVQFPSGTKHVFCYAYYVTPPPTSGTIVVRKALGGAPDASEAFVMGGNISYDPSGTFTLTPRGSQPAQQTFYRAATAPGGDPWTVTELVPDGWALAGLSCTRAGASVVTTDRATTRATIALAAGDTVTCTYTNVLKPTAGAMLLRKVTLGGVGTFTLGVRSRGGPVASRTVTTRAPRVAATAKPVKLRSGLYRATERRRLLFRRRSLVCNGRKSAGLVRITPLRGAVCTFTNRRRRLTRIGIRQVTQGALGTAGYATTPLGGNGNRRYLKTATTRRQNVPRPARGSSTLGLPYGVYVISQSQVRSRTPGTWTLVQVRCNRRLVPFSQGRAIVRVTPRRPRVACTFTNRLTSPDPVPPAPPEPPVVPGGGQADLVVTKRAQRTVVPFGGVAPYTLTVRNTGTAVAEDVVVADAPGPGAQLLSAEPSQGSCRASLPVVCRIGTLAPGQGATVAVRLRLTRPGRMRNFVVVGSGSNELRLRDNGAVAAARVLRRPKDGACVSLTRPRARSSC